MRAAMGRAKPAKPRYQSIAFVADVHLGNFAAYGGPVDPDGLNVRGRLTVQTFERALVRARELGCSHTIVGGDLFEHRRPEPAIVAWAQRVLAGRDAVVIPGNHDNIDGTSMGGNTACETVHGQAKVLRGWEDFEPSPGMVLRCVPFEGSRPMADHVDDVCRNLRVKGKVRAIATHVGAVDESSPPWLRDAPDSMHVDRLFEVMEREDVTLALVGNHHKHREWERGGRAIVQVGVLNPRGHGDEGLDDVGGLVTWDGVDVAWHQVPGPRFLTLASGETFEGQDGCTVFTRQREAKEALDQVQEAKAPPTTAEQALEAYAAKLPVEDGDRAALTGELQRIWRAAT